MPHLLTLSLCRFDFDWDRNERNKISTHFAFPSLLDVTPYLAAAAAKGTDTTDTDTDTLNRIPDADVDGSSPVAPAALLYDLMAVVIHSGSAHSGHYHAYIRDVFSYPEGRAEAAEAAEGAEVGGGERVGEGSSSSSSVGGVEEGKERWFDFNDSVVKAIAS